MQFMVKALSRTLKCNFEDATWYPYRGGVVQYKKSNTFYIAGYSIVVCIWQKKTAFKVVDHYLAPGETWFTFSVEHRYNLHLWSREQIEKFVMQSIELQQVKERLSTSAYAKIEQDYLRLNDYDGPW